MADVTLASGVSGTPIVLSGNDQVFEVTNGKVDFSTDGGTTNITFRRGEKVVFTDGLTVGSKNNRSKDSSFSHMAI